MKNKNTSNANHAARLIDFASALTPAYLVAAAVLLAAALVARGTLRAVPPETAAGSSQLRGA